MRKSYLILFFFFLLVSFFILKGERFFLNVVNAQNNTSCHLGGENSYLKNQGVDIEKIMIQDGSTVCQVIKKFYGNGLIYTMFFENQTTTLNFSSFAFNADEGQRKTYFQCDKGKWIEKKTYIDCKNESDDILYRIAKNKNATEPLFLKVKEDVILSTPTPLPSSPSDGICVVKDKNIYYPLEFNQAICLEGKIYECIAKDLKVTTDVSGEIKSNYPNYNFYKPKVTKCFNDLRYCNTRGPLAIGSIYCTSKSRSEPTPTIGHFDPLTEDVYGLTCGVPKESITFEGNLVGGDYSRCCNIPEGFNTSDQLERASENLGCLINEPFKAICYGGIMQSILRSLKLDNVISQLKYNPLSQASKATRPCVEGSPLVPAENIIQPPPPTPTRGVILISGVPYVRANQNEFGREYDCRCLVVPNSLSELCEKYVSGAAYAECQACLPLEENPSPEKQKLYTALGCISLDVYTFIREDLFRLVIGFAGLIALFCIIYAAFQLQTSQGNPDKIKKSQELLTSCITGLMLIIFSVFILKLIGVDVLKIPRFG